LRASLRIFWKCWLQVWSADVENMRGIMNWNGRLMSQSRIIPGCEVFMKAQK
jgi:hypothetical protein